MRENSTKIFTKNFCVVYLRPQYAVSSLLGKHFAWILRLFFAIMRWEQKNMQKV
jgi:hypothetical protein